MSDYKVGDRVRVTVEGTVKKGQTSIPGYLLIGSAEPHVWFASFSQNGLEAAVVEKLAPLLPTVAGSVILVDWQDGQPERVRAYVLDEGGKWRSHDRANLTGYADPNASPGLKNASIKTLFDAGAV